MTRIALATALLATTAYFNVSAVQAQTYGNAPWCAVRNLGTGEVEWDCEYASVAACAPTVVAGNRGFCNENPYFVAPYPASAPRHRRRRRRHY